MAMASRMTSSTRSSSPFFTTKPGGAGIGLALARQIALAHGGGLTAARAQPSGSVFMLRLPAAAVKNVR